VKSLTILLGAAIFVTGAVLLASYPIE
jgi:hypothetical protein